MPRYQYVTGTPQPSSKTSARRPSPKSQNNSPDVLWLEFLVTKLKDKLENALNEGRILMLGGQVLVGSDYRSYFDPGFDKLPYHSQVLNIVGLGLMLLAIALLIAPPAYHRIVEYGRASTHLNSYVSLTVSLALMPFAIAIAIQSFIAMEKLAGLRAGLISGSLVFLVAVFFWYGLEVAHRSKRERNLRLETAISPVGNMSDGTEDEELKDKVKEVLIEARMVLPGAQALLGFQFATMLMEGFDKLPLTSKYVHFASLTAIAISTILLITPAAYHRIVERGEDSEQFHQFASRMLLAAMVWLALGLCGDFYVVCLKVTASESLALSSAIVLLIIFYSLWFGYTSWKRSRLGATGT